MLGEGTLNSQYNGVVTQIELSIGDAVDTGTVLITLNDYDEVTVTVSVEESELENINEGDAVNVSISAYPDEEFTGTVEEIGDSEYDSSTGNTYADVTVKLSGDTAKLYEGMSVEITFITKETEAVTYAVSYTHLARNSVCSCTQDMDNCGCGRSNRREEPRNREEMCIRDRQRMEGTGGNWPISWTGSRSRCVLFLPMWNWRKRLRHMKGN